MSKVGAKHFIIYKSHMFPQLRKPIRTIMQTLMVKNPDLDRLKAKKMTQLLDEQQKRRLKSQKQVQNENINSDLQKYYLKYIEPFQFCPDYYPMLFKYAVKKAQLLKSKVSNSRMTILEPFFIPKEKVNLLGQSVKEHMLKVQKNQNNQDKKRLIQEADNQAKTQEQQKIIYEVYQSLYPYEKVCIYHHFMRLYKNFLINQESASKQILQGNISLVRPFVITSPLQLYQSKHSSMSMTQCEQFLISNEQQKQKIIKQFSQMLEKRFREVQALKQRHNVHQYDLWRQYRRQYYNIDKYKSFYSMLKNK